MVLGAFVCVHKAVAAGNQSCNLAKQDPVVEKLLFCCDKKFPLCRTHLSRCSYTTTQIEFSSQVPKIVLTQMLISLKWHKMLYGV